LIRVLFCSAAIGHFQERAAPALFLTQIARVSCLAARLGPGLGSGMGGGDQGLRRLARFPSL